MAIITWRIRRSGIRVIVELDGELDVGHTEELSQALTDLIVDQGNRHLVVDMAQLRFVDSSGFAVLVRAHKLLAQSAGTLTLRDPQPLAHKSMEILGLTRVFHIESGAVAVADSA